MSFFTRLWRANCLIIYRQFRCLESICGFIGFLQYMTTKQQYNTPSLLEEKTCPAFSPKREIILTWVGIMLTLFATVMVVNELLGTALAFISQKQWLQLSAHIVFCTIAAFLVYGGLVYLITRLGYLKRRLNHTPASQAELDKLFNEHAPSLTILVPSYKEDEQVIYQTLMSAALQEYPVRRVVLLIDDPGHPANKADALALAAARALPVKIRALLRPQAQRFERALSEYKDRLEHGALDIAAEAMRVGQLYLEAARWFGEMEQCQPRLNHTDELFIEKILVRTREAHLSRAECWMQRAQQNAPEVTESLIRQEYARLDALFRVEITSFERKRFENLSHEANKAMNLNSYIGLMGKAFNIVNNKGKHFLHETDGAVGAFRVPDSDYIVTLDADSLILTDYALRLVHLLEQQGNQRIAVAQTPYSAIPNAPGTVERISGATTDIQYIIHQGFTHFNATYWVGANALIRKQALHEIAVKSIERGYPVMRYIQDRTVIEDTESSIDLVDRGWQLYNYPERLAYSATPPDFGSLLIQRRRWANGGLIILPKLLRYLLRPPYSRAKLAEGFMRFHYLSSIAAVNIGLLIVLAIPFSDSIKSLWLPLTSGAYFFLYGRDLVLLGYRRSDLLRVYAMNLLLIPVNMGGVLKSMQQAWTKQQIPFGRTPKVHGRTAAAPLYILAVYLLIAHWMVSVTGDIVDQHYGHAVFAMINTCFMVYATIAFIGLRESAEDLRAGWLDWRLQRANKLATPGLLQSCSESVSSQAGVPGMIVNDRDDAVKARSAA